MKTVQLEYEEKPLGRRPKKIKVDNRMISKLGNAVYYMDEVKAVKVQVHLKNGTSISFKRSENEDVFNHIRSHIEEEDD